MKWYEYLNITGNWKWSVVAWIFALAVGISWGGILYFGYGGQ